MAGQPCGTSPRTCSHSGTFLEERLPALRQFFRGHDRLKNADYRSLFGLARYASARELKQLVEQGYLRLEGERRGAHYRPLATLGVAEE